MGWFDTLFSAPKTIEKTTDAVINTVDKIWYTDEEKAETKLEYTKFMPTLLNAYKPFKIAQRILAMWFSFLYGLAFILGLSMEGFNIYTKYQGLKNGIPIDKIILLDTQPLLNIVGAFSLGTIILVIIGFYFAGGTIESFKNNKKD